MQKLFACGVLVGLLALPAVAEDEKRMTSVDLAPKVNKTFEAVGRELEQDVSSLPAGEQTCAGVKFQVGKGVLQLTSTIETIADLPEEVKGLKVEATVSKLHFLHASAYRAKEGTIIGYYTVNYTDGGDETIPVVYGKDVRDWWVIADSRETTRGKVGWEGEIRSSKLRLFVTTWKNPDPSRKVKSIDFGSTKAAEASPFCVAITAEE